MDASPEPAAVADDELAPATPQLCGNAPVSVIAGDLVPSSLRYSRIFPVTVSVTRIE